MIKPSLSNENKTGKSLSKFSLFYAIHDGVETLATSHTRFNSIKYTNLRLHVRTPTFLYTHVIVV